jgi:hypothetical protein
MRPSETMSVTSARVRRLSTGPLPRLPPEALVGARTLEAKALPMVFLGALALLVAIQVWLAL